MSLLKINIPFCIGATATPDNPGDLPSTLDFEIGVNSLTGGIQQILPPATERYLIQSYELGLALGTPSDDDKLGKPYVDDFIDYVRRSELKNKNVLEIGSGTGYISRRLLDLGAKVTSIEPGKGYEMSWQKYQLDVINDFFPTKSVNSKFDLIIFYTVFEHISDASTFLEKVKEQLSPGGKVILSVPDCSKELSIGDPSIFMHEHVHYFNENSLHALLELSGLKAHVERSKFGRSIYATAKIRNGEMQKINPLKKQSLKSEKLLRLMDSRIHKYSAFINKLLDEGSLGVYVPSRALNYLPSSRKLRFFDDASYLKGKYFPPFCCPIENREQLFKNQPEILFVATRTFGEKLKREFIAHGFKGKIITLTDIDEVL